MESSTEYFSFDDGDKRRQSRCDTAVGMTTNHFSIVDLDFEIGGGPAQRSYCKASPCQTAHASTFSCAKWILQAFFTIMKSLVPRRVDEPTGPFELVRYIEERLEYCIPGASLVDNKNGGKRPRSDMPFLLFHFPSTSCS